MTEPGAQSIWKRVGLSLLVWLCVCAVLVIGKLALAMMPAINIPLIRSEFATSTIIVYGAIGALGAVLAAIAGLPAPIGGGVSPATRFAWPLIIGAALGAAATLIDQFTHGAAFVAQVTGQPTFNVDFPQSLPVYLTGAILPEAVYHMLPLSLLVLVVNLFLRSEVARRRGFVLLATVVALIEPLLQGGGLIGLSAGDKTALFFGQFLPYFATAYPMNLAACLFFGRSGFLSAIIVRIGFYIVWHIVYGNFFFHP